VYFFFFYAPPPQTESRALPYSIIKTAEALSESVPASFGAILFSLLPPEIQNGDVFPATFADNHDSKSEFSVSVLTASKEDRYLTYKRRIREAFAHRGSVVFVSPTNEGVIQASEKLLTGIADRSVVLSSALPKRALKKAYGEAADLSVAKVIITTPSRALIDRPDITDVIIDESGSSHFKARSRPYLSLKDVILLHSRLSGRRVLLGDLVHSAKDELLRRQDVYLTEDEEPHRINLSSQLVVVEQKDRTSSDIPFQLFSDELLEVIATTVKEKKNVFLYSARRGISPVVACGDCGHIFRCPDSGAPYSLFRTMKNGEERRWFLSPTSGRRVRAADICPECGSWKLRERGIGIQHIHDELKKHFPEDKLFLFDHITASTRIKAHSIVGDFYDSKGGILIGTAMALPYLEKPVTISAVVSLDAVRSAPTWRVDKACFYLLMKLREITLDRLFVQTRTEPDELLTLASSGSTERFFNEELKLREDLRYPPFYNLIHLTMVGPLESVRVLEEGVVKKLAPFDFSFYSGPESTTNKTIRYGLCRVPTGKWPDRELIEALKILPPSVRVEIDPDKIV
ncbi:MAG: hypothetical protein WD605_02465, partial [Candidatus Paceibacterota bacterium]